MLKLAHLGSGDRGFSCFRLLYYTLKSNVSVAWYNLSCQVIQLETNVNVCGKNLYIIFIIGDHQHQVQNFGVTSD